MTDKQREVVMNIDREWTVEHVLAEWRRLGSPRELIVPMDDGKQLIFILSGPVP